MNKDWVIYNLKEAKEELDRTIVDIENDPEYDLGVFFVSMQHLYHHLNTAWNSQNASQKEVEECIQENFNKWGEFPKDIPNFE